MLYPRNCGLIGRKDFTDLRDTTLKTFLEICPEGFIRNYNKTEHHIIFVNGSEVYFRELKDRTGLGSLNLGFFYIDEAEEVEESVFDYLKGRLSLQNVDKTLGWLTSNPPNEDHWIFRQFEQSNDIDYATFHASTYENKDNLPEGYIADLEKLPPSWRKKYLEGQYGFTPDGRPFYEGYNERFHKRILQYNPQLPILRGFDYGYHHPACVITQIDNLTRWHILKEFLGKDITIDKFADYINAQCNILYPDARYKDFGDPAGNQVSDKNEKTSVDILASKGIRVYSQPSTYRTRKEIIEIKLSTIIENYPALMVDTSCRIINDAFLGGYHYPIHKKDSPFNPKKYEEPFRDSFYEHCMNALEYIAVCVFQNSLNRKADAQRRQLTDYGHRRELTKRESLATWSS